MGILAAMFPMAAAAKAAAGLFTRRSVAPATDFQQILQQTQGTQLLARRDADGDGLLSATEFPGESNLFTQWDANGDGKLSAAEVDAGLSLGRKWELLDSDRSNSLTRHEFGVTKNVFNSTDKDRDGVVSRREFHRAYLGGDVS